MNSTTAQVLRSALALSADERVDLAAQLLRSAGTEDAERLESLRRDVTAGFEQIDRGEGIVLGSHEIRDYLRGRGRVATERANPKTA